MTIAPSPYQIASSIPDTYRRYKAEAGSLNGYTVPGLVDPGAPYGGTISEYLVVKNKDTEITSLDYSVTPEGTIDLSDDLEVGDILEIWKVTPGGESLVTIPVPTNYDPRYFNMAITQLLYLIQELWGGLKEQKLKSGFQEVSVGTLEAGATVISVPKDSAPTNRFILNVGGTTHVCTGGDLGGELAGAHNIDSIEEDAEDDTMINITLSNSVTYSRNWWFLGLGAQFD